MELTKEEIEMCQTAVGIVTDTRTMTDDNMAKWDMLYEKLEVMLRSLPTKRALDFCPECLNTGYRRVSPTILAKCFCEYGQSQ